MHIDSVRDQRNPSNAPNEPAGPEARCAYRRGRIAADHDEPHSANPYSYMEQPNLYDGWRDGWLDVHANL